eukprot:8523407-Pyramimonas_sp.AAC.1
MADDFQGALDTLCGDDSGVNYLSVSSAVSYAPNVKCARPYRWWMTLCIAYWVLSPRILFEAHRAYVLRQFQGVNHYLNRYGETNYLGMNCNPNTH